ncbi:ficolin-1-like [Musca autumnalis]|uniref:ficolin-1-like n=1 Tax=Musca autumnalis TaxID=221902 RepID=UPI003CEB17BE
MQDFNNKWGYSHYKSFYVEAESDKYRLRVRDYLGSNGGHSLTGQHNDEQFSTYDQDNDKNPSEKCASLFPGGWWHFTCDPNAQWDYSNLNGFYYKTGAVPNDELGTGITWRTFNGINKSLKYVAMKIRRK